MHPISKQQIALPKENLTKPPVEKKTEGQKILKLGTSVLTEQKLTNAKKKLIPKKDKFKYLGIMSGEETFLRGANFTNTYGRVFNNLLGSNYLRKEISETGSKGKGSNGAGENYKIIGDEYAFTPAHLSDGRPFNSTKPTTRQGGGFFLTVKDFGEQDERDLNCFKYALRTFGNKLEKVASQKMETIERQADFSIDSIITKYFTEILDKPKDGDLVTYSVSSGKVIYTPLGIPIASDYRSPGGITTTHAGIYRESSPNWNSPMGGTVESKWGFLRNQYVFQHDMFFVPDYYGDEIRFYRLKDHPATPINKSPTDLDFEF